MRLLAVVALLAALPSVVCGQPVSASVAQNELYTRARTAFGEGDYTEAIDLLEAALRLGEVNIFRLSLGRALFRDGRCDEARWQYERALVAPAVADPTPEQVAERVTAYRADLERDCPGTLILRCSPPTMSVHIDELPQTDCVRPLILRAGAHHIRAEAAGRSIERDVELHAMEELELRLDIAVPRTGGEREARNDAGRRRKRRVWGWTTLGVGTGVLATAVLLDTVALEGAITDFEDIAREGSAGLRAAESRVNTLRASAITTYVAGAALVTAGTVVLLRSRGSDGERSTALAISPSGAAVTWTGRY